MKSLSGLRHPGWFFSIACLALVFFAVGLVCSHEPKPAAFLVLHKPVSMPMPLRDRLLAWFPAAASWNWMTHLQDLLFGRRKPINIYTDIISLRDASGGTLSSRLALDAPSFSATNGVQVWLLSARELKSLRERLKRTPGAEFVSHPRISTADGVEASIYTGESVALNGATNQVGLEAAFFPRVHRQSADLIAMIAYSEVVTNESGASNSLNEASAVTIQTNLDVAVRLQIPKGSGLLLLDGRSADPMPKRFGLLIEPPQPTK
jgi:hypothetical protein